MPKKLLNGLQTGAAVFAICAAFSLSDGRSPQTNTAAPLPAPGTYKVDPDHTFTYFSAWHHIVGAVRGRFDRVTGTVKIGPNPAECGVEITIAAYSISTQNTERDADLRGPAFFDVEKFPTITYRGAGIRAVDENSWTLDGLLRIRDVTKIVPLTFTFKGKFAGSKRGRAERVAFHGFATTKRGDFGMTRDNVMELGAFAGSRPDVDIEIDVEADAATGKG